MPGGFGMKCPRCQHENRAAAKFCEECSAPLRRPEGSAQPTPSYADLQRSLNEALEQQTATSEILRVISSSTTDVQPVFDAIVRSAVRLCDGLQGVVDRFDGELIHFAAQYNYTPEALQMTLRMYSRQPDRKQAAGRAILTGDVVNIADVQEDPEYATDLAVAGGWRSILNVPMLREGKPIGTIGVIRGQAGQFSDAQVELLRTFADQAVIAVENVRLFTELQTSNRELTTALDTQTATSDILGVISRSPTDVRPVFDAILASAVRLLGAYSGHLTRVEGDQIVLAAFTSTDDAGDAALGAVFPMSVQSGSVGNAQVIRDRQPINLADAHSDPRLSETGRAVYRSRGSRSQAIVPLLRRDEAIGTIAVARREPGGFTGDEIALLKTFADQAVIAIENVRLFKELQMSNRDLTAALERQTATSDILRVISSSPTNTQPVFDAIARNAVALCGGIAALVLRFDGEMLHVAGHHAMHPDGIERNARAFPRRPRRDYPPGRAFLDRNVVHVPDLQAATEFAASTARQRGAGSQLAVPLLREHEAIGVIGLARDTAGPFSPQQIGLLQAFADQAVIAIENVRLFNETKEALEQRAAASDILRVISTSPTDVQPVFEAIVASAARLCDAVDGTIFQVDGDKLVLAAHKGPIRSQPVGPLSALTPGRPSARAVLESRTIHVVDLQAEVDEYPEGSALARSHDFRTVLSVPLIRAAAAIGVIAIRRTEARPFTERQTELLKTFADQAVIAIENVRLFKELQTRNSELTEALEQQTATSEILRVISSSPTDVRPIFDTIVRNARRLCGADSAGVLTYDGKLLHIEALDNDDPERANALRRVYPRPANRGHATGRAILLERPVQIPDVLKDPEYALPLVRDAGIRSVLAVPMIRAGTPIGAIAVQMWVTPRPYSNEQIALLSTFANQAVIAIENVRLFTELEERNRDLTQSLERQTATSELLKVIGRSTFELKPVFDTLAENAVRLCAAE